MSCYDPWIATWYPKSHKKYGQPRLLGKLRKYPGQILTHAVDKDTGEVLQTFQMNCGKCIGCRLDYAKEFAGRICMEQTYYPNNSFFVTLTYSDENLPCIDSDGQLFRPNGMRSDCLDEGAKAVLLMDDLQKWFMRLRSAISYNYDNPMDIRYYACGEYGPSTLRPHFHVCLFGLPGDDLQEHVRNKLGNMLYTSGLIEETWGNGFAPLAVNNYKTAGYTARYTMKKANGLDNDAFDKLGLPHEFTLSSRRPGLAKRYYDEHKEQIYKYDEITLNAMSKDDKVQFAPPRYFDKFYEQENPKRMHEIKEMRALCGSRVYLDKLNATDLDEADFLFSQEQAHLERSKKLIRDL